MICDLCNKETEENIMVEGQTAFTFKIVCSENCYQRLFTDESFSNAYYKRELGKSGFNNLFETLISVIALFIFLFILFLLAIR